MFRLVSAVLIAIASSASAQVVQQSGPWNPGHVPMYSSPTGSLPSVIDGGSAAGGPYGKTLSELGITSRATTGIYPSANSGNGQVFSHFCMYDAPITNQTGYHYLCFDPNAMGGGLIAYGANGGATPLPLHAYINGVLTDFGALLASSSITKIEALTVTSVNTLSSLSSTYNNYYMLLFVNGATYTDHDTNPLFTAVGKSVTWSVANAGFTLRVGDRVTALYTVSR